MKNLKEKLLKINSLNKRQNEYKIKLNKLNQNKLN